MSACCPGGVRAPSWSHPGPTRPEKWGTMLPPWWISSLRSGYRSSTPENTIRAMKADRSYSHPKVHQIS